MRSEIYKYGNVKTKLAAVCQCHIKVYKIWRHFRIVVTSLMMMVIIILGDPGGMMIALF